MAAENGARAGQASERTNIKVSGGGGLGSETAGGPAMDVQSSQEGTQADSIAQAIAEVNGPTVAPVTVPLPEHWAEATDQPSGNMYYYHIPT